MANEKVHRSWTWTMQNENFEWCYITGKFWIRSKKNEFINDYGEEFVSEVYQGKRIEENRYREMNHEQKYAMNKLKELF